MRNHIACWGVLALVLMASVANCSGGTPVYSGVGWAWGDNNFGRLGDGTTTRRTRAVQISGNGDTGVLDELVDVQGSSHGSRFGLALNIDGDVWSWGNDRDSCLGNGDEAFTDSLTAVSVATVSNVIDISAGGLHAVSLLSNGATFSWGACLLGYDGCDYAPDTGASMNSVYAPHQVEGGLGAGDDLSANGYHTLVASGGGVFAWGQNSYGELGDNSGSPQVYPVRVLHTSGIGYLSGITAVACGLTYSVALKGSDGTVFCWGDNSLGQLGNNTTTSSSLPVQVVDSSGTGTLEDVVAIAAGHLATVVLKDDGTVWTWGYGIWGQLGNGSTTSSSVPVQVKDVPGTGNLTNIVAIAAGFSHALALDSSGNLYAWGLNDYGQLGNGTTSQTAQTTPILVTKAGGNNLTNVIAIGAGWVTSYAVVGVKISADWVDDSRSNDMDWVYQNTPVTTQDRHKTSITIAVDSDGNSNSTYTATVTEVDSDGDAVGNPILTIAEDQNNSMKFHITGPRMSEDFTGNAYLKITVTGDDDGGYAELFKTLVVRALGDVNGDGVTDTSDSMEITRYLNGISCTSPVEALDLNGDTVVDSSDTVIMNKVLNGFPIN